MAIWIGVAVVALGCVAGLVYVRRTLVVVEISGESMRPTYRPGDRVLVRQVRPERIGPRTVIVLREPQAGGWRDLPPVPRGGWRLDRVHWVIKRVVALPGEPIPDVVRDAAGGLGSVPPGNLVVLGDSARSGDSRSWGLVPTTQVLGSVVRRLARAPDSGAARPQLPGCDEVPDSPT